MWWKKKMDGRSPGNTRTPWLILLLALILTLGGWIFYQDLKLGERISEEELSKEDIPSVSVSSLELDKDISGDRWTFFAREASRKNDIIHALSLDMTLKRKDGTLWKAESPVAEYSDMKDTLTMNSIDGQTRGPDYFYFWRSPEGRFSETQGEWVFPLGITVENDHSTIYGNFARSASEGILYLENGAEIIWKIQDQ